ncbi:MAG: hypothetical protein PVG18_11195 [Thioalkalispiraceae bacterium]
MDFLKKVLFYALTVLCLSHNNLMPIAHASSNNDPHYSNLGFFDIHVCNWPNRPLFFMALFSTYEFANIKSIEIISPSSMKIGELNLDKFRLIIDKKKREKRVFIKQLDIPKNADDGWYKTIVTLNNGKKITAEDYVVINKLDIASIDKPDLNGELKTIPKSFSWKKIPGAKYYQVFIHDKWESKLIYSSDLLSKPELKVPAKLLHNGGLYSIQIHARDSNEHQLLGDFNHGSLSKKMEFSISE